VAAKSSTNVNVIPSAEETRNLSIVTRARVTRIATDKDGRATGVVYVRGGTEYFQPADMVLLATYVYENNRLLMLSKSKAHPDGIGNDRGQLGRHYMAHAYPGVNGLFEGHQLNTFSGSGAQFVAFDDYDADNFDHKGLGFIGGATIASGMENKPIQMAHTIAPGVPQWGSAWKDWIRKYANSVGSCFIQLPSQPYHTNRLDLDPTTKDPYGNPVIRLTYRMGENEQRLLDHLVPKMEAWLKAAGATTTWAGPLFELPVNSHAYGGTRMGNDPDKSVVDKWGLVHDTPGLAVLGGSTFPSTGSKNPTQTIEALAWRTADHVVRNWKRLTD
jgi:gluconate 2-dehydrogenase alpha chain